MSESLIVDFDEEDEVLTDQMGLMLPPSDIDWLEAKLARHKSHSATDLEGIGKRTVEKNHPTMVKQFNFDYFKA